MNLAVHGTAQKIQAGPGNPLTGLSLIIQLYLVWLLGATLESNIPQSLPIG